METIKALNNGNASINDAVANQANIQAGSDMHGAVNKMTDQTQLAVDRVAAGAHSAIDKISVVAAEMSDKLSEKGKQLLEAQERLMAKGREQVKESPATSIAIALAAGIVIGKLLGFRK